VSECGVCDAAKMIALGWPWTQAKQLLCFAYSLDRVAVCTSLQQSTTLALLQDSTMHHSVTSI